MKKKILTISVILVLLSGIGYFYWIATVDNKYIDSHCPSYKKQTGFVDTAHFIDCAGLVGIEKWDDETYPNIFVQVTDTQYSFQVKKYILQEGNLFYIEDSKLTDGYISYHAEVKKQLGDNENEPMIYRKLNVKDGTYTLYESITVAPEDERPIFEQLLYQ